MILRKTMFDDCKGERLQELLASFSTLVLRKVLATGKAGKASIAGRLAIAKKVTAVEYESFLPLAVAHRASLTALLRRKSELRGRYMNFGKTLNSKEQELDRRFETVMETQNFLDGNTIPDHTVSRLSKQFEKHWHGDSRLVHLIVNGEEEGLRDSLLDNPFPEVWPRVSDGTYDVTILTSQQGLLKDLEKRVVDQEKRLNHWKEFKDAMRSDGKPAAKSKHDLTLTRTKTNDSELQRERDFVFSPRKSPRKSAWGIEESPKHMSPTIADNNQDDAQSMLRKLRSSKENLHRVEASKSQAPHLITSIPPRISDQNRMDESSFSEVSSRHLNKAEATTRVSYVETSDVQVTLSGDRFERPSPLANREGGPHLNKKNPVTSAENLSRNPAPAKGTQDCTFTSNEPDEDDLLAEQIVSTTMNAAPTPAKPTLSLVERTRKSMAFASPVGLQRLATEEKSPLAHSSLNAAKAEAPPRPSFPNQGNLLERTRQSISLVPPQPRKSMHNRRTSKNYPTSQFETPEKQQTYVNELTPPEELFSPGAGYDSVFKSRPKIAFSPSASPSPGDSLGMNDTSEGGSMQESPSARKTTRV